MIKYINFDESELDNPLYRIVSVERFFELLVNKKNTLVSPSLWEDPFEAFTSKAKININGKMIHLNNRVWGQCWTTKINETDAMWRIYTPSKNGVKIKTTARKLLDSFLKSSELIILKNEADQYNLFSNENLYGPDINLTLYCGKLKYLSVKKITDPSFLKSIFTSNSENILFIKRLEFKHESEFRIVFEHFDYRLRDYYEPTFKHSFNFNEIVEEIVFDPRMDRNLYSSYKSYVISEGYKGIIKQSKLYSLPKYNFNL
jgi:hypothetical protein